MQKHIFVGIDLGDKNSVARIGVDRNKSERLSFINTRAGRARLFREVIGRSQQAESAKIIMAYEASSCGFILRDEAVARGIACEVLAPTKMDKSVEQRMQKTDDRDGEDVLEKTPGPRAGGKSLADGLDPGRANARRSGTGADAAGDRGKADPGQDAESDAVETPGRGEAFRNSGELDASVPTMAGSPCGGFHLGMGSAGKLSQFAASTGWNRKRAQEAGQADSTDESSRATQADRREFDERKGSGPADGPGVSNRDRKRRPLSAGPACGQVCRADADKP